MSHVSGQLEWSKGIFEKAVKGDNGVTLHLADGTTRFMKYENWDKTVLVTERKLAQLKKGQPIKIAVWGGYDAAQWFCDVEPIDKPSPDWILSKLSPRWIIRDSQHSRNFGDFRLPVIDCRLITNTEHKLGSTFKTVSYIQVTLHPKNALFNEVTPSLSHQQAKIFYEMPDQWFEVAASYVGTDRMASKFQDKWYGSPLLEFMKFCEECYPEQAAPPDPS